ncbi:hypothetical protein D7322_08600 [Sphingobacterium puteale]|uniref:Uncharacterized protein n=1 Tax=Sphingobacterium puteale TaxID=2420510 RepID=A0A420W0P5_9SPHI|nr:hypothetical protein [Sphingobacterium puteale]RKO72140.1 hypothetical protein D7322_08600 [Sphingobacterium puteale]
MIKQPFTQIGVDNAQAAFMTLTALEQSAVINMIRTDFDAWMNQWFALTMSQQQQIETMDPDFKLKIAIAIANTYQAGYIVNFTKEDPGEDIPDRKETQVFGLEDWQDLNDSANGKTLRIPLMIKISYDT